MYYYNYYKSQFKDRIKSILNRRSVVNGANSKYRDLGIINTTIGTTNMGDFIIFESVWSELRNMYPEAFFTNFPSHFHTSFEAKKEMSSKDYLFVSGTNLLSSNMDSYYQWKLDPGHKKYLKNKIILFGVGWWQYQDTPNVYTKRLLNSILTKDSIHSVRDSYTCRMLNDIGISNVVNTSCPTLWGLTKEHCSKIRHQKTNDVVTTLTFYNEDLKLDKRMLDILVKKYDNVYLWVQGLNDLAYLDRIYPNKMEIHLISPGLEKFDELLCGSIDYIGTRLHAGARALQKGNRAMILAVDNRAIEIAKDTNLNVIPRENVEQLSDFIDGSYITDINLPLENIAKWKSNLPFQNFSI